MKIEANRPNLESVAALRTSQANTDRVKNGPAGSVAQGSDRVHVSEDAALAASVRRAADAAPDLRQDLVDRMRAKLAAGEIGKDPERLADRLIDHLLDS